MQVTDMLGHTIQLPYPPKRIISLVPSQTELLHDLGLEHEVVGITKFCIHPNSWFRQKTRVGGTKTVHFDIVNQLQPDLIIANKEENTKEQIEHLASLYPVWTSDIKNVTDALVMIKQIGYITGKDAQAQLIADKISTGFDNLQASSTTKRVAYFIWRNPWMCAGGDTFISDIIKRMGWKNSLEHTMRYPTLTDDDIRNLETDIILLSSEPYPFKDKHIQELKQLQPNADIILVDGEMFSWYGSRLLHTTQYLKEFL